MTENVKVASIWSIHNTHTQMQNRRNYQIPSCCQVLNIWWEEHNAYHRSRSHQHELIQVQATELSMLSNSALRDVDPHLYHRKRRISYSISSYNQTVEIPAQRHLHWKNISIAYTGTEVKLDICTHITCGADFEVTLTDPSKVEPLQLHQGLTQKSLRLHLTRNQGGPSQKAETGSWGLQVANFSCYK